MPASEDKLIKVNDDQLAAESTIAIKPKTKLASIRGRMKRILDHFGFLCLIVMLVFADIILFVFSVSFEASEEQMGVFSIVTLVIISLFCVEVFARMAVFGMAFFTDFWMVLDGVVVIGSLLVEVLVTHKAGGLIIFLRLTRVARIVLQILKHGHVLKAQITSIFKSRKAHQSPLEYCVITIKSLQTSGLLDGAQLKALQNVIDILGSGKLYETTLMIMDEKDQQDTELKDFLNQNFNDKPKREGIIKIAAGLQKSQNFITQKQEKQPGDPCYVRHKSFITKPRITYALGPSNRDGSHNTKEKDSKMKATVGLSSLPKVLECLSTVDKWEFDIFELDDACQGNTLFTLSYHLFESSGLVADFQIDPRKLQNFLFEIQAGYRAKNPYHNALHGADVLHATYWLLQHGGELAKTYNLLNLDLMAAFVAAIIHDFEHPGINNAFCIKTGAPVAITYNDKSVLENHHVSAAFRILQRTDCNIFERMTEEAYRNVRDNIIVMVMATDMQYHFQHLSAFKTSLATKGGQFTCEDKGDKTRLLALTLHYADVSNPSRPPQSSQRWTKMVCEEFFRQGDLERHKQFPISPMFDRNDQNVPKSQRGFLQYVVQPFFNDFIKTVVTPGAATALGDYLTENLKYWEAIPEEEMTCWTLPAEYGLLQEIPERESPEVDLERLRVFGVERTQTFSSSTIVVSNVPVLPV